MRHRLLFMLAATLSLPSALPAQGEAASTSAFPEFIAQYDESLRPVDKAFEDLTNENLPLRDENGQPVGRRRIEDRRQTLVGLRTTLHQLASSPRDLVLTTTLFIQMEALVDDLFDLTQLAYDNDREELGKRFSDLEAVLGHKNDLLEDYLLKLAAEDQDRIRQLEQENRQLQEDLKRTRARTGGGSHKTRK